MKRSESLLRSCCASGRVTRGVWGDTPQRMTDEHPPTRCSDRLLDRVAQSLVHAVNEASVADKDRVARPEDVDEIVVVMVYR